MNNHELTEKPNITPIKVERKRPTGTRELSLMSRSLDNISEGMHSFMETINRSSEKESEIAARLCELIDAIKDTGQVDERTMDILEDLDARAFQEKYYTEKSGGGVIRMTDDTRMSHLRAFASEAAKVSAAKFKMSADDYVPKDMVVHKANQTIDIIRKALNEHIGPAAGAEAIKDIIEDISEVWDDR